MYDRAGVERVIGFCTEDQAKRFLQMAPLVELLPALDQPLGAGPRVYTGAGRSASRATAWSRNPFPPGPIRSRRRRLVLR